MGRITMLVLTLLWITTTTAAAGIGELCSSNNLPNTLLGDNWSSTGRVTEQDGKYYCLLMNPEEDFVQVAPAVYDSFSYTGPQTRNDEIVGILYVNGAQSILLGTREPIEVTSPAVFWLQLVIDSRYLYLYPVVEYDRHLYVYMYGHLLGSQDGWYAIVKDGELQTIQTVDLTADIVVFTSDFLEPWNPTSESDI